MKTIRNERGDMTFASIFFIVALVMLLSFLLLFASVRINCINIRNGVKMELNNLTNSIFADTYRSQREVNFATYLDTLYSSRTYQRQLEDNLRDGLATKIELENDDYKLSNISLEFRQDGPERVEYICTCDVEFYITMFGSRYPTVKRQIVLTGHHNTKF